MTEATPAIRDRIVGFQRVKAKDITVNPLNWRVHNEAQRSTLRDLLSEVGIAGALICRQMPDGKLLLIDGELRQGTDPKISWPVLVLDVSEEEANKLLLSMDPLSAMATADLAKIDLLRAMAPTESANISLMWETQRTDAQRLLDMAAAGTPGLTPPAGDASKLADRFLLSPFSVLSARDGWWQERKRAWLALGIQSELGRGNDAVPGGSLWPAMSKLNPGTIVRSNSKGQPIEKTLGAIPPNQKAILGRQGKYGKKKA